MSAITNRREFLKLSLGSSLAVAGLPLVSVVPANAIEPIKRPGGPKLRLSLAAYSFRDFFPGAKKAPGTDGKASRQIDLFEFIDYCVEHECEGTELTSYYFPKDFTPDYLLKLKHHAFLRGIAISGTAVGNNFTVPKGEKRDQEIAHVKKWIDYAQILGAPHIRVFAGSAPPGMSKEEAKKLALAAFGECCDYAGTKGVFLGLENHGGIVAEADDLLELVQAVQSPWFGINLDTGNFHTDDPYGDLARCAPYAVNVQFKADMSARGKPREDADLARIARILREANYQGYVALEYESAASPWDAVPVLLQRMKQAFGA